MKMKMKSTYFSMNNAYRDTTMIDGPRLLMRVTAAFEYQRAEKFSGIVRDIFDATCLQAYDEQVVLCTGGFLE